MDPAEAVYAFVKTVPPGKVVTYGQVAAMVEGVSVNARQVGSIMAFCPAGVPWQRVVGSGGRLPIGKRDPKMEQEQRRLLALEGVAFRDDRSVDMDRFQWDADGGEALPGLFDER